MTPVTLTPGEILRAAIVGVMRQVRGLQEGLVATDGAKKSQYWQIHIDGALGECALAKHLGLYWSGVGELRQTDVGGTTGVDVRTRSEHHLDLVIKDKDPDDRRFYLVTGSYGSYQVHGWIMGRDGKQQKWWSDAGGRQLYFVPQSELNTDD